MPENQKHLLIVDDEGALRSAIAERLADHGFVVEQAGNGEDALQRLTDFAFDILITDLRLPGIGGREVLDAALERYPDIIAIVITGYGTVKDAVEAIKQGASDFITKPFQFDALLHVLRSAVEQRRLKSENAYLRSQLEERYRIDGLVGRSGIMRDLFQLLETVAATSSTVLITGETGTGKELVARALHRESARASRPFVALNTSAIAAELLESELFGHEKGAFTGATERRIGRFEQANGGTLFLDEIGELPLPAQVKLLRALQQSEIEPVGARKSVKVDVRIISATNRDLIADVKAGRFREDLFYRLHVFPLTVPPLRTRPEDIPELARHFLARFVAEEGKRVRAIDAEAMALLNGYSWPGNVRQLENAIFRAVVLAEGETLGVNEFPQIARTREAGEDGSAASTAMLAVPIVREEMPMAPRAMPELTTSPTSMPLLDHHDHVRPLDEIERDAIRFAISHYRGQMSEVARRLQIGRSTLYRKLETLGLEAEAKESAAVN